MAVFVPPAHTLVWPTLQVIRELGGSATLPEITEQVVQLRQLGEDAQSELHGGGPRTELDYRLAWARTYLKNIGAVENSARGVWQVTELGRGLDAAETEALMREWRSTLAEQRQGQSPGSMPVDVDDDPVDEEPDPWDEVLIRRLVQLTPDAFERLAYRLLREAGFVNVSVTGRSGDGGIDGVGMYRLSLVSFPVFFQCKRYRGSVGSSAVRDFRGAMQGRGDKGLLITTGTFTSDAKAESTRDGATAIDLVDGARLCVLLKDLGLGVNVVERVVIDEAFFADL